jgi:hypothetical protein
LREALRARLASGAEHFPALEFVRLFLPGFVRVFRKIELLQPRVRTYYIAADEVIWNYLPQGRNMVGTPSPDNEGPTNPTTFRKAVYHEYTDATFKTLKPRPPQWETGSFHFPHFNENEIVLVQG